MYGSFRPKSGGYRSLSTTTGSRGSSVAVTPTHTKPLGSTAYHPPGQPSLPAGSRDVASDAPARSKPTRSELRLGLAWIQARSAFAWTRGLSFSFGSEGAGFVEPSSATRSSSVRSARALVLARGPAGARRAAGGTSRPSLHARAGPRSERQHQRPRTGR